MFLAITQQPIVRFQWNFAWGSSFFHTIWALGQIPTFHRTCFLLSYAVWVSASWGFSYRLRYFCLFSFKLVRAEGPSLNMSKGPQLICNATVYYIIQDHLINAIASRQISCLCLLLAAFDTIDHNILLAHLSSWFAI